jgi:hypothetical protein
VDSGAFYLSCRRAASFNESFKQHFNPIDDHRQSAKVTYPLFDILFGSLCAVIAGSNGWFEIREYILGHHSWFKKQKMFIDGIPADDTIARIVSMIDPESFNQCFLAWMKSVHQLTNGEVIAIDNIYHIQTVNGAIANFKAWVNESMKGVTTKYLSNYLAWFKESSAKLDKRQILLSAYGRQQYYET